MISSTDIHYFIEVAATQNLSRAAERLGIAQPSLSAAIKRLESAIGTELLIRHKKGVLLTQAGKQLLAHAKQLLQHWDEIKTQALASHFEVQGRYILGCHPSMALHYLSGFLPDLMQNYPKLEVNLVHDISRKITEQVINLSIDIGIVVNPVKHPDLVIHRLLHDQVTFWQLNEPQFPHQNIESGHGVLICDPELSQTQTLLKQLHKKNFKYSRLLASSNLEVVADLTINGCGIGILPRSIVRSVCRDKISAIPKITPFQDEICLIYRHENRSIKAMQVIIESIKRYFKTLQGCLQSL